MCPEIGMRIAVLALRTQARAIGEYGLETIEAGAHDIHAPVGDQTRQVLPHALAHDARLAVVHAETLFAQNGGDVRSKPLHASLECFAAGKRQIVGVARVLGASRLRQPRQPAIHPVGAEVGKRRRGRCALG
jgi:hypothetical protein